MLWGIFLVFCAAWGFAGINVWNRKLKDVNASVILFLNAVICFILCAVCLIVEAVIKGGFRIHSPLDYAYLLLTSAVDYAAVTCAFIAYQSDSPSFISLLSNMTVFYSFVVDYFVFGVSVTGT